MKKYKVINKLTSAVCGVFNTPNEAGKWVEEYTHEQNKGLSPNSEEYCSPFHFEMVEEEAQEITSYEDAKRYLNIPSDHHILLHQANPDLYEALLALHKLFTIAEAWNQQDGFVPDFSDKEQRKFIPVFAYNKDTARFRWSDVVFARTETSSGSRLCFATPQRAIAFGKQFEELYNDFLLMQ